MKSKAFLNIGKAFDKFSTMAARATGSTPAFIIALSVIVIWVITGPIFKFSDTWQLVINTGTTIITFLMVFLIQKAQNKDSLALQLKLNELVAATKLASNRLIDVEELSEDELRTLEKYYSKLADLAKKDTEINCTHSIEEAMKDHERKEG